MHAPLRSAVLAVLTAASACYSVAPLEGPPSGEPPLSERQDGGASPVDAAPQGSTDEGGRPGSPAAIEGQVVATDGDTTALLAFLTPASTGGPVLGYEYDRNEDGVFFELPPDRTVVGLTNGVPVRFRVRGRNAYGPGLPSAVSNTIVPYGSPAPPTITSRVVGEDVTWTWTPNDTQGRAVVSYVYRFDKAAPVQTLVTTFRAKTAPGEKHTLVVAMITDGAEGRNRSEEAASVVNAALPTVVARGDANAFGKAGAGAPTYAGEIDGGKKYTIDGACFRPNDIASNPPKWWYRNAATKHWAASSVFDPSRNEMDAPIVDGGNGCGAP